MTQPNPRLSSLFELEYPQSVGSYDSYVQAQAAVDFLADAKFAVQNLAIVGTDLKSVERVTGRRSWGTVLLRGGQNGISTGLMVTLILWFLQPQANPFVLLPGALLIGVAIGVVFAAIGYAASRGKRDFNSISQTVAARYEVLCEHKVASEARQMLATMPGAPGGGIRPAQRAPALAIRAATRRSVSRSARAVPRPGALSGSAGSARPGSAVSGPAGAIPGPAVPGPAVPGAARLRRTRPAGRAGAVRRARRPASLRRLWRGWNRRGSPVRERRTDAARRQLSAVVTPWPGRGVRLVEQRPILS